MFWGLFVDPFVHVIGIFGRRGVIPAWTIATIHPSHCEDRFFAAGQAQPNVDRRSVAGCVFHGSQHVEAIAGLEFAHNLDVLRRDRIVTYNLEGFAADICFSR